MAFVVEDGTGKADATSFCTEAFADTYHTDRGNDGWTGSSAAKQAALVAATAFLEASYPWATGRKATQEQALGWPRFSAVDREGFGFDGDIVPVEVQQATAEFALRALTTTLGPDLGRVTSKEKVGALEVEYADREQETAYPVIEGILRGLVLIRSGVLEVQRT